MSMIKIGEISACQDGDVRYVSCVSVWTDIEKTEVRFSTTQPRRVHMIDIATHRSSGQMQRIVGTVNHPGGINSNHAREVLMLVREACRDATISKFGKPTRQFAWGCMAPHIPVAKGLSVTNVQKAYASI